jgi:hypothetical protein
MLTTRTNFHHSKLPAIGAIGRINIAGRKPSERVIVSHYPLSDNVLPYSIGIHTIYVRSLKTGRVSCYSAMWFESEV